MKRTFAAATYLGCIALLGLTLQTVPLHAKDIGKDKSNKTDNAEKSGSQKGQTNPPANFHVDISPIERHGGNSFAPIIKKTAASVVSVFSSRTVQDSDLRSMQNDLLRRFFGGEIPEDDEDQPEQQPRRGNRNRRPRSHQETGLGSGVIVTEDGYILTNNHVIEDADDVKVETSAGTRYTARVVGTDAATDTALIKIDGKDLPAMTLGNSEGLEVGDVVLAIGNPFGLGQTVTMGIVSALGRTDLRILGNQGYEDFIQTDAAINLGNSGGALIDTQGRLVGINAAILSRTGGNVGVGFAVPINMARNVMESLTRYGRVARGFLGVKPQRVDAALARKFNLPEPTGALVADFPKNADGSAGPSVAREAGLQIGDVITEFNGKKVTDDLHLRLIVSQTPPDTESTVKVLRDGKEKVFKLKLAELPNLDIAANGEPQPGNNAKDNESLEGVTVDDIDPQARSQFKIPRSIEGAIVSDVDPDSKSYEAGLRAGDVIMEIDHKPVRNAKDAVTLSEKAKGPDTLLRIYSHGNTRFLTVENGTNEPSTQEKKDNSNKKPNKSRR